MSRLDARVRATFTAPGAEPFDIDAAIQVDPSETLVVLGPSGSGKTLVLESIAGFHGHEGQVALGDCDLTDLQPEERGFGFVFQDYALFPNMTVRKNVDFGARYHEDTRDPDDLLAELGISQLADRSPPTLSGGEKQRVALARALAVRPDALLLDEPLSALDAPTRQSLRDDLADALADVTAVYVTHNRTTARALADRIAVMHDGEIVQEGPPEHIFEDPGSPFVARFTGANVVAAAALPADAVPTSGQFAIRPEHVQIAPSEADFDAKVVRVAREDAAFRVTLRANEAMFTAFTTDPPAVGERVGVGFPAEHRSLFAD